MTYARMMGIGAGQFPSDKLSVGVAKDLLQADHICSGLTQGAGQRREAWRHVGRGRVERQAPEQAHVEKKGIEGKNLHQAGRIIRKRAGLEKPGPDFYGVTASVRSGRTVSSCPRGQRRA